MTRLWTLALALALLTAATGGWATPSTLIWIPSTDIQPDRTWHLGIDNYFTPTEGSRAPTIVGLTAGFGGGKLEAGVDYFGGQDDPLFFRAECQPLAESADTPAVVIGLMNFGTRRDVTDYNMVYGLLANTFGGVRLTAGYSHGNENALGRDPDMLLAGVDGYLSADQKWWGAVDYQSGENAFGALNLGVSQAFADNVSVILGCDVYNDRSLDDTVTTQLDLNF